jgi:hypothetical protein
MRFGEKNKNKRFVARGSYSSRSRTAWTKQTAPTQKLKLAAVHAQLVACLRRVHLLPKLVRQGALHANTCARVALNTRVYASMRERIDAHEAMRARGRAGTSHLLVRELFEYAERAREVPAPAPARAATDVRCARGKPAATSGGEGTHG